MGKQDPHHPQPDDLPEHERTGDEPNPSGHPPAGGTPAREPAPAPARTPSAHSGMQ